MANKINIFAMRFRTIFSYLLTSTTILLFGQTSGSDNIFYSRYQGEIEGEYLITANIIRLDANVSGTYNYRSFETRQLDNANVSLPVVGKAENGMVSLKQFGKSDYFLEGEISKNEINGIWNLSDGNTLAINLTEEYPDGSLPFEVHYLHSEEKLFKDSSNSPIAEIELTFLYPAVNNSPNTDKIEEHISNLFFGKDEDSKNADTMLTHYEKEYYDKYRNYNTERYMPGASFNWQSIMSMNVLNNSNHILSMELLKYAYTGGAHGMTNISYCNIDLDTGNTLSYSDIFNPDSDSLLGIILTRSLYTDREIPHDISLKEAGYFVDSILPNDNFFVNADGIGFTYNTYEIAPYASGQTTILLKFNEILPLMLEGNSVYKIAKMQ